ncbi:MAG: ASKHA domain-containing protein [Lachnospiraceae bacterium]|jgi:uncharacterized 2Fe-2S/4Fe-4S cluster protein (DUF4445 family)
MKYKIVFQPSGTVTEVEEGTNLLVAAQDAGVDIQAYCGGGKVCGKCRIKVVSGQFDKHKIKSAEDHLTALTQEEAAQFKKDEVEAGYRLACAACVKGDLVIEVPRESQKQSQIVLEKGKNRTVALKPAVKRYYLELEKADLKDNRDDYTRVCDTLMAQNPEITQRPEIDFETLRKLPTAIRKGDWKITIYVWNGKKITGVFPGEKKNTYGVAVDIGTTTVAAYLCDLQSGEVLQSASMMNPQVRFGDDVISRVSYCMTNENGLDDLNGIIIKGLNELVEELAEKEQIHRDDVAEMVLVFNTVMHHIALKIPPDAIGMAPFISGIADSVDVMARDLGIRIMSGANVHCLPSEAGYVGADNVAVLIAEEPYNQDKIKMIIDIGTNSEIALGNKDKLYSTSCATGPALEGAQIRCGMRAAKGAIEGVEINQVTLEPTLRIIGQKEGEHLAPIGICGSGILDVVAQMAITGIIEADGKFTNVMDSPRLRVGEDGLKEYVLYEKQKDGERDIVVTAKDIRAVQLAKAALYAGAKTLMQRCGIDKMDEVILAGAFGSYIDKVNALKLGLFPDCLYDKITVSGNAAGVGARLALFNVEKREEARKIARQVQFVETAGDPVYAGLFADAILIPHGKDPFIINKPSTYPCGHRHNGENQPVYQYKYDSIEEMLEKEENFPSRELLEEVLKMGDRQDRPEDMIDVSGPFSILAYLISPTKLYRYARKNSELLEDALLKIEKLLAEYVKEQLDQGIQIISFSDPMGVMELVGEKFYQNYSGKYNYLLLKDLENSLKKGILHICGKTSYGMEKAGYLIPRPKRVSKDKTYHDIMLDFAKERKIRFMGHGCANNEFPPTPLVMQLDLVKGEK